MFTETTSAFVWDCIWQSTIWLAIGGAASMFWRHWPARAHRVILLALLGCLVAPFLSLGVRQSGWGLLSRPASELAGYYGNERALQVDPDLKDEQPLATTHSTQQAPEAASLSKGSISSGKNVSSAATESFDVEDSISWVKLFVCTWAGLSIWVLCNMLLSIFRELSILRKAQPITDTKLEQVLGQTMTKLDLRGTQPRICSSDRIRCPVIFCWGRRPTLLLPGRFLWSPEELAGLLSHELAHWKRRDHWAALVGELIVCFLPWQPLVWWAKRRMANLSELACDHWVLASGEAADIYAESLLELVPQRAAALALPAVRHGSRLEGRIRSVLQGWACDPMPGGKWASIANTAWLMLAVIVALCQTHGRPVQQKEEADRGMVATRGPLDSGSHSLVIKKLVLPDVSGMPANPMASSLTISPDGRRVAFISRAYSDLDIVDLRNQSTIRVTESLREKTGNRPTSRFWITGLLWSPEGDRLVFNHLPVDSNYTMTNRIISLRIVSATGGVTRIIYQSKDRRIEPHGWSADGKWILATVRVGQRGETPSLIIVPVDGGQPRSINAPGWTGGIGWKGGDARLSSDGKLVAFERQLKGRAQIILLSLENGQEIAIGPTNEANMFPQWSSDGRYVLFKSNRAGSFNFWGQRVEGGKPVGDPVLLKRSVGEHSGISQVLKDGRLVYWTWSPGIGIYSAPLNPATGLVVGKPRLITFGRWGVPSPDNQWLAFSSFTLGTSSSSSYSVLQLMSLDGKDKRTIGTDFGNAMVLSWFPDGKSLLLTPVGSVPAARGLRRLELATGKIEIVCPTVSPTTERSARLSPDGKRIAFVDKGALFVADADPEAKPLSIHSSGDERMESPTWSPDGSRIAFISTDVQERMTYRLLTISASGGEPSELARFRVPPGSATAWSPDSKFVVYSSRPSGQNVQLWIVPASGGEPVHLSTLDPFLSPTHNEGIYWSADGKELFFTGIDPGGESTEYWMLENYLPEQRQAAR